MLLSGTAMRKRPKIQRSSRVNLTSYLVFQDTSGLTIKTFSTLREINMWCGVSYSVETDGEACFNYVQ